MDFRYFRSEVGFEGKDETRKNKMIFSNQEKQNLKQKRGVLINCKYASYQKYVKYSVLIIVLMR